MNFAHIKPNYLYQKNKNRLKADIKGAERGS